MLRNKMEPRSQKTRRPSKAHTPICSYRCYLNLIRGCYSCQWDLSTWKNYTLGSCCCTWKEKLFFPFLLISFTLSLIMLFVWMETSNEYFDFDWAVFITTGLWAYWSIVFLSIFGILTAYTSLLMVLGFLLIWEGNKLKLHWCHKLLIVLVSAIVVALLCILCVFWRDKWLVAGLSLKVFAPYWHLACIILMVILSWPVSYYMVCLEAEARYKSFMMPCYKQEIPGRFGILTRLKALQLVIGLPFFIVLLFLYLMPMGIHSPCIQEKESLGPKPTLFGHRGAPMLGPENTMMSFEKAVEHGAHGLEFDIHLSTDSVPFLMHDHDLRRTTDIREVLPSASWNRSDSFSWDVLSTLNAGKWFLKDKPFYKMEPLSEADNEKARSQKIPKLHNLLDLARKEKKYLIFDLTRPPRKHPLRDSYISVVVSVILASKIDPHLIFWLPGSDRDYVRYLAPGFQHVGRLESVEKLAEQKVSVINVDYKELFYSGLRHYKAANITINVYIINKPWLFSLAWCSRIHSVTTDNVKLLSQMNHPLFFMTPRHYMYIWLLIDTISAVLIFFIFYFHWWKERQREDTFIRNICRDTSVINLSKGGPPAALSKLPTHRVSDRSWTLTADSSSLTHSTIQHLFAHRETVLPQKKTKPESEKTAQPPMPAKGLRQLREDTQKPAEPPKAPTTLYTRSSSLLTDSSSFTTVSELTVSSSQETFVTIHSSPRKSF